jgi:hypothetical protein
MCRLGKQEPAESRLRPRLAALQGLLLMGCSASGESGDR